jgi:endonuclease YncB( thermonuclease family)
MYQYRATLQRVIDGDTIDVTIDLGFYLTSQMKVRLRGVNTPEIRGPERPEGLKAKAFVEEKLPPGKQIVLNTYKVGKYGRYIADVFFHESSDDWREILDSGITLNQLLLEQGLAEPMASD